MSNMKLIKMKLHTGYVGATHEDEFELDVEGLSDEEIEGIIDDALDAFLVNEISTSYEIEDI